MSQPVIIDFSRVEEALRLSSRERDVLTARERTRNAARLIKYSAVGSALVIVSIGVAFWLGMQWHRYQAGDTNILTQLLKKPEPSNLESMPANKIVTNINLFNTIKKADLGLLNPYLLNVSAGHEYVNSNATAWENAWCYADFRKNDFRYQVDLEIRNRAGHVPMLVSQNERLELGLTDSDIAYLRRRCPWK